jgi:hypothetical protein
MGIDEDQIWTECWLLPVQQVQPVCLAELKILWSGRLQ